jgi:hypothetical protein
VAELQEKLSIMTAMGQMIEFSRLKSGLALAMGESARLVGPVKLMMK